MNKEVSQYEDIFERIGGGYNTARKKVKTKIEDIERRIPIKQYDFEKYVSMLQENQIDSSDTIVFKRGRYTTIPLGLKWVGDPIVHVGTSIFTQHSSRTKAGRTIKLNIYHGFLPNAERSVEEQQKHEDAMVFQALVGASRQVEALEYIGISVNFLNDQEEVGEYLRAKLKEVEDIPSFEHYPGETILMYGHDCINISEAAYRHIDI